jgi:hypothetical protein
MDTGKGKPSGDGLHRTDFDLIGRKTFDTGK